MSTHTPAPWFGVGGLIRTSEDPRSGDTIASTLGMYGPIDERRANVRLIAAAPRMLDVLQDVVKDIIERGEVSEETGDRAARAIVLAKEGPPTRPLERDEDERKAAIGGAKCLDCGASFEPVWKLIVKCPHCGVRMEKPVQADDVRPPAPTVQESPDGERQCDPVAETMRILRDSRVVFRDAGGWGDHHSVTLGIQHVRSLNGSLVVDGFFVHPADAARVAAAFGLPWPAEGGGE